VASSESEPACLKNQMSTTNPADVNVEFLLKRTAGESRSTPASSHDENPGGRGRLEKQVSTALSEIEQQITTGAVDPASALNLVVARALTLIPASGAAIGLVIGSEVVCCATAGTAPDIGASIRIEEGLSGECIRSGRIVRWDDTARDSRVDKAVSQALSMRSAMAVPVRFDGNIVGVFEVFSAEPNAFDDGNALAISQLAQFVGAVANACTGPFTTEALPAPAPVAPPVSAERSGKVERKPKARSFSRWRVPLLIALASMTAIAAVSYRVRDMIRSTRSVHRAAEISPPALPSPSVGLAAATAVPVAPEPEIAREDGRIPQSASAPKPMLPKRAAASTASPRATPLPKLVAPSESRVEASVPLPKPLPEREVAPDAPLLAAVASQAQREATIDPLMKVPVVDPRLAPAQVTQPAVAKPHKARRLARIFAPLPKKSKTEKQSNKHPNNPTPADPATQPSPVPER
jgi:hypothetical protein